jgi:hypothetical protein
MAARDEFSTGDSWKIRRTNVQKSTMESVSYTWPDSNLIMDDFSVVGKNQSGPGFAGRYAFSAEG